MKSHALSKGSWLESRDAHILERYEEERPMFSNRGAFVAMVTQFH